MKKQDLVKLLSVLCVVLLFLTLSFSALGTEPCEHKYVVHVTPSSSPAYNVHRYVCSLCGHEYTKLQLRDDLEWGRWEITIKPTCLTTGEQKRISITDPSIVASEALPALGHAFTTHTSPATCTERAKTTRTCGRCTVVETTSVGELAKHNYRIVENSIDDEGNVLLKCSACGDERKRPADSDVLPQNDEHKYVMHETIAGCETAGKRTFVCSDCGDTYEEETQALGHDFGKWETVTRPNLTEQGLSVRTCSRSAEHTETETLPRAATLEIQPVDVVVAGVNIVGIIIFAMIVLGNLYVLRWERTLRKKNVPWSRAHYKRGKRNDSH